MKKSALSKQRGQHTPAPWKVDGLYIFAGGEPGAYGPTIAKVYAAEEGVEVNPEQAAADARLIAKAPEMFERIEADAALLEALANVLSDADRPGRADDAFYAAQTNRALLREIEEESREANA